MFVYLNDAPQRCAEKWLFVMYLRKYIGVLFCYEDMTYEKNVFYLLDYVQHSTFDLSTPLPHCGLVTPYDVGDLAQQWFG